MDPHERKYERRDSALFLLDTLGDAFTAAEGEDIARGVELLRQAGAWEAMVAEYVWWKAGSVLLRVEPGCPAADWHPEVPAPLPSEELSAAVAP